MSGGAVLHNALNSFPHIFIRSVSSNEYKSSHRIIGSVHIKNDDDGFEPPLPSPDSVVVETTDDSVVESSSFGFSIIEVVDELDSIHINT